MVKLKLRQPGGFTSGSVSTGAQARLGEILNNIGPKMPKIRITAGASTALGPRVPKVILKKRGIPKSARKTKHPKALTQDDVCIEFAAEPVKEPTPKSKTTKKRKRNFEPGLGYDSEKSDREEDPAIEEQFILRMAPGPDCDYLRGIIQENKLDTTPDVWMKFKDQRKAVVCVRRNLYTALLVDLPCIIESSKTFDNKQIFKTADICQMLVVGRRIPNEEAINNISYQPSQTIYPHGLTPPLRHVRKRRFQKRVSYHTINAVEAEVDRLLEADANAKHVIWERIKPEKLRREKGGSYSSLKEGGHGKTGGPVSVEYVDADENLDALPDAGNDVDAGEDEDELAQDLEEALMQGEDAEDFMAPQEGVTAEEGTLIDADEDLNADGEFDDGLAQYLEEVLMQGEEAEDSTASHRGAVDAVVIEDEEDEEDESEEDGDEDAEGELDEDALAAIHELKRQIFDLEISYRDNLQVLQQVQNPLLKARKQAAIDSFAEELEFKRNQLLAAGGTL